MKFLLIISPGPANYIDHFWTKISFTYSCHAIRNYGLYIFSKHVLLWENLCIVIVINYDCEPSESNPTCSEDSTIEDIIWHILSFEIFQKTKGLFLVWHLGVLFISFQLGLLEFGFSLLVLHFFLKSRLLEPLAI